MTDNRLAARHVRAPGRRKTRLGRIGKKACSSRLERILRVTRLMKQGKGKATSGAGDRRLAAIPVTPTGVDL